MAIKQKAVDGFLASLGSLTKDQALANLALDARSYRWNAETVDAIAVGIHRHYPGYDDISVPLAKISNCYESWKVAPQERKAFHAMTVQRELEAAFAALSELQAQFGDVNGGTQPRFDNEQMAETAVAAGGVLRLKTINRLCDLAPDDDGEEFVPMTEAELAAMNARFAANPEVSF